MQAARYVLAGLVLALCAGCAELPNVQAAQADPLNREDPHVAQLFNILRQARGQGDQLDMVRLDARLRDVGRAHAIEYEIDQATSEQMILQTAHKVWAAAQKQAEILNSLEAFNKAIGAW